MMRWSSAALALLGSLGVAGCLATPPSGLTADPDAGDVGGEGDGSSSASNLVFTGLASRDPLTLDMRDELVIVGRRESDPVAVILYPGAAGLEDITALEVSLPVEPIDLTISRWGLTTGLAVILGADGRLIGIDKGGATFELTLAEAGEPITLSIQQLAELNINGRRLTVSDGEQFYVTDPLETGQPGEHPIDIYPLGDAAGAVLVDSSFAGGETGAIGVMEADYEIDVYPVTAETEPESGPDQVVGDVAPGPLLRPSWQMSAIGTMVLIGIDPAGPGLWYQSTSVSEVETEVGTALDGAFDVIHDLVVTRLDDGIAELAMLAEEGGQLEVVVYLDPAATPESLPSALVFPVSGLSPPYWMQAMDAVFDVGDPGQNEIVVYDQAGHVVCVDLVGSQLESCGSLDLAELLVTARGVSTSGRPDW